MREYFETLRKIIELDYGPDYPGRESERNALLSDLRALGRVRARLKA